MSTRTRRNKHNNVTDKENRKVNGQEPPMKPTHRTSKQKLYCMCRQSDDGTPMILCSECKEWYHFRCVDLPEEDAEDIRLYICPSCHEKTGLHTVMNWEGPEAVEERPVKQKSSTPSGSQLKSTKTRSKAKTPEPEEEEESSNNDESEDEYVADDNRSQPKRRTRKLSLSEDSASSDGDGLEKKNAPKRLRRSTTHSQDLTPKRESESPGASNARKRRPSTATHAVPQSKRRKSESTTGTTEDATRKYCFTKLEEVFTQIFLRYPLLPQDEVEDGDDIKPSKKTEELTPEEKELVEAKAKAFVGELEQCLFDLYSEPDRTGKPHAGAKYKERFRMLTFNLSKTDRVILHMRIASSHISAKELSTMSSTDLANEEQKQSIKQAEREALAQTILKKTILPRAKMTHKGIQDIEDIDGAATRERETKAEEEEEDRIERERQARLRLQAERAQAQAANANQGSVPPESPITPTWGGPPPVPNRPLFVSTGSELMAPALEGELNLADLINIDEEPVNEDEVSTSLNIPPPPADPAVPPSPSTDTPDGPDTKVSAQSHTSHATGISPFAAKPDSARRTSFDLSSLWSPAKDDTEAHTEQEAMLVEEPDQVEDQSKSPQQTSMEVDGLPSRESAGDQDFDMFLEQDEEKEASVRFAVPETKPPTFDELPHVWTGKISMPLDSTVPQEVSLFARQVGGRALGEGSPLWKTLFPVDHLRIDGRVPIDKSAEYLTQTRLNAAKELIAAAFNPASEESHAPFDALIRYLLAKGRHGLVFPWGPRPKDNHPGRELYIIPLLSSEVVPEYMELLDNLQLPKTRDSDLLIGIWVLNKGKLVAPPSTPPIPSVFSTTSTSFPPIPIPPQAQPQQPQPQNPLPVPYPLSSTSLALPPLPPAVTAEIASLTPEQIQLMLRTLQATTQPHPASVPAPIGIPQASLQQWTNPAPAVPPAYPPYVPPASLSSPPPSYVPPPVPSGQSGPYPSNYDHDRYSEYPEYSRDQHDSYGPRRAGPRGGGGGDRGPRHRGGRGRNVSRGGGGGYGGSRDGGWKSRGRGRDRGGPASPGRDGGRRGGGPPPYNNQWGPS